ncbi:hypothetical protein FNF27_05851 [Cafeteria roenbergensis]|uniref:Uncharacterized protein n=1 Tax=Cafeteria roenbergensis TaxID=33653 RepID=A0A5A8E703_CAFRO|nr:hypothetical protein FNF29_02609 [Cafeteria roenbergensis]KAA0159805.1 hypothetical protein FNF28_05659 [Cafeteria roenbergensis]KAA0172627.1 hypothetical protein FNF27_05851 [Cafeteria roenbergensis]|eukprot:KAA0154389.1 hypothetical protein FNF29_02609 [Cafeteria roenbergensis]
MRRDTADRISNKIHAALWVVGAVLTLVYTKLVDVVLASPLVDRLWFNLGVVCFVVSFGVLVYMTFWLRYVEGIYLEWEVVCPNQLKLGAVSGALAFVFLTIGLWPVYSLFTVAILGVVFFGGMMLTHFVPAC